MKKNILISVFCLVISMMIAIIIVVATPREERTSHLIYKNEYNEIISEVVRKEMPLDESQIWTNAGGAFVICNLPVIVIALRGRKANKKRREKML
ncbi:MAG: hypothetical protein K6G65_05795 [Lachnospiraceae bacterium]|nr:hypothetical protein [Lachnospiraceae bacterium]